MTFLLTLLLILPSVLGAPGVPGLPWSQAEVAATKAKIWDIMKDPDAFVTTCGNACWKGCDRFDVEKDHPSCTHCDDIICPNGANDCQCCTGWCEAQGGK